MSTTPPLARRTRRQGSGSAELSPASAKGKLKIGKYVMGDTLGECLGGGGGRRRRGEREREREVETGD